MSSVQSLHAIYFDFSDSDIWSALLGVKAFFDIKKKNKGATYLFREYQVYLFIYYDKNRIKYW